ncbi:hypothetical protein EV697_101495 [Bisgaardia hudsonensis]|uniref:Uncharacterized protein n=1 Tax=Bisgaardia hudsonensis TaxID=109472 RepID=A0A4R2N344_9PAST|nr:hypothetical protein EV697_101495 [Bisgaardia hudsonensis]
MLVILTYNSIDFELYKIKIEYINGICTLSQKTQG